MITTVRPVKFQAGILGNMLARGRVPMRISFLKQAHLDKATDVIFIECLLARTKKNTIDLMWLDCPLISRLFCH